MANRIKYVNPLSMGLLGGVSNWAQEMEKYNLLNFQNEARQKAYDIKYSKMADVANLRAQNNRMIAAMKAEIPQKQYTQVLTGDDGNKYVSMGHMIPDTNNPNSFVPHEDTRMTLDEYNKFKGGGRSGSSGEYTLSPGQQRRDTQGNVIATNPKDTASQDAIAARQAQRDKELAARQDKAEQLRINSDVMKSTNSAMREFDKATPDEQAALAKSMGLDTTVPDPTATHRTLEHPFSGEPDPNATKPNDALRKQYRDAIHKQALEEATGSSSGVTPAETGDTTMQPTDNVPTIIKGADGKSYSLPDGIDPDTGKPKVDPTTGKVRAVPLAMDAVDTADNSVAQASPDEESGETTPDNEQAEGEGTGDIGALLDNYRQQSDAAMAQNQNAIASDYSPEDYQDDQSLLAG